MIDKERYVLSFIEEPLGIQTFLRESEAKRNDICPSVGKEIGQFLNFLVCLTKSQRIIEIGTSIGYSTLWLALGAKATGGHVHSIEASPRLFKEAKENISKSGLADYITLHEGLGETVLPTLEGSYDLIFIDGATKSYEAQYEIGLGLLKKGGLFVFEDVLFACTGKRKAQKEVMGAFNEKIKKDKRVITSMLNIGDGIMLCMKS